MCLRAFILFSFRKIKQNFLFVLFCAFSFMYLLWQCYTVNILNHTPTKNKINNIFVTHNN